MIDKYIKHIKGTLEFYGVNPDELKIMVKENKIIFLYNSHFSLISLNLLNFLGKEGIKFDLALSAAEDDDFEKDKIDGIQITVEIDELKKMKNYLIDYKSH